MEFIIINGERVQIPQEIVSESREAVGAWVQAEAAKRGAAPVTAVEQASHSA